MNRDERVEVFQDTFKRTKAESVAEVIKETDTLAETGPSTNVEVVAGTSFGVAKKYADKKVCVLNFASATNAGGGVKRGSSAQEECLCRESSLYKSIMTDALWDEYYAYHRERHNNLYTNRLVFVPKVKVIKDANGKDIEPFFASVIGCAAPNLREKPSNAMNPCASAPVKITDKDLLTLLTERYRRVIALAEEKGVEVLVTGAIGCGAFKNKPEIVARAWKDALKKNGAKLEKVVFGIYCGGEDKTNYTVFKRVLG